MIMLEGNRNALYQWDLNQRIILTDVGAGVQVHYSDNDGADDLCLVLLTYELDGAVYADVPNKCLQKSGTIYVYVCVEEDDRMCTKYRSEILVLPRKRPAGYIYTETEVYAVSDMVAKALQEAKDSGEFDGPQGEQGEDGYTPVRGVDYWTDADKEEIKSYVDEAILGGVW